MTNPVSPTVPEAATRDAGFVRGLNLFDATMIVVGVMIGSGIFIVSADMARLIGSPGWLLMAWLVTGILTITAALSYGELASMMPHAGGMYVYLSQLPHLTKFRGAGRRNLIGQPRRREGEENQGVTRSPPLHGGTRRNPSLEARSPLIKELH